MMTRREVLITLLLWLAFLACALAVGLTVGAWEPLVGGFLGGCGFAALWHLLGRLSR